MASWRNGELVIELLVSMLMDICSGLPSPVSLRLMGYGLMVMGLLSLRGF